MSLPESRVATAFALPVAHVTLREPVFVDFDVRNGLAEPIHCDLGHNRKSHFQFTITDSSGRTTDVPRLSEEGAGRIGRITVTPRGTYSQRLLLTEWHEFAEPGEYTVVAQLVSPIRTGSGAELTPSPSEPLRLQIAPREPKRLVQICQALARSAVEAPNLMAAREAVLALGHVRDRVAVPYLALVLLYRKESWSTAIPGLARIANESAVDLLIALAEGADDESSPLAVFMLADLHQRVSDPELRTKIAAALPASASP